MYLRAETFNPTTNELEVVDGETEYTLPVRIFAYLVRLPNLGGVELLDREFEISEDGVVTELSATTSP